MLLYSQRMKLVSIQPEPHLIKSNPKLFISTWMIAQTPLNHHPNTMAMASLFPILSPLHHSATPPNPKPLFPFLFSSPFKTTLPTKPLLTFPTKLQASSSTTITPSSSSPSSSKSNDQERIFFDGGAHYGDLLANLLFGFTLLWLPLTLAAVSRAFFLRYRFTNLRVTVISGFTGQDRSDFSYKVIKDVQVVPRFIGEWGDIIITLKDGTKVDLRSVPKFREIAAYCLSMAGKGPEAIDPIKGDEPSSSKPKGFWSIGFDGNKKERKLLSELDFWIWGWNCLAVAWIGFLKKVCYYVFGLNSVILVSMNWVLWVLFIEIIWGTVVLI